VGSSPISATFDPIGKFLYVANFSSNNVSAFTVDHNTGVTSTISGSPFSTGTGPVFVVADPAGSFLYAGNQGSNNITGFSIDSSTGALKSVTTAGLGAGAPSAMTIAK
jgi:6-phosphogluconolactonase (cycloisomerase 2 family)